MNDIELDELLNSWSAPAPPASLRRGLIAALPVHHRSIFGVPPRWVVACVVAALGAALGAASFDGSPVLSRFSWGDDNAGLYIQTTRMVAPAAARFKWWWFLGDLFFFGNNGGALHGGADVHNRLSHIYYGYNYVMEPAGDGKYQVSFSTMELSDLQKHLEPYKVIDPIALPTELPPPEIIQVGQPFEVTLFRSGGERIYDRILLSWSAFPKHPKQQSTTTMRLSGPKLFLNGQFASSQRDAGAGPVIWVHLPSRGRFLIALDPQGNPRFAQAGYVNGNVLEFQSEGDQFRIVCTEPIAAGGRRPVFVYHQQSFENMLDPAHVLTQQPFLGNAGPARLHQE